MAYFDDFEKILQLPLIQLAVCGRSGSMLLHALIDGHPEVLHIPHTFKFYDFVAATPQLCKISGSAIAKAFVSYERHDSIFDSEKSVLLRGRLGLNMQDRVLIDKKQFTEIMTSFLPGRSHTARKVLFAAVFAHAMCQGQPVCQAKIVFMHLHHGDWLWPEALTENINLFPTPIYSGIDLSRPNKLVITVRNPVDQISSYERFVTTAVNDVNERRNWFERYLKVLAQDWKRLELVKASGIPLKVIRLEDIRSDTKEVIEDLAVWMGISSTLGNMNSPTLYGLPWWGDIYSNPSLTPNTPQPIKSPNVLNADHTFLYSAAGDAIAEMKYPKLKISGLTRITMKTPFYPHPQRDWPMSRKQWKEDLNLRNNFLKQLEKKHKIALAKFKLH